MILLLFFLLLGSCAGNEKLNRLRALFSSPRVLAATGGLPLDFYVMEHRDEHLNELVANRDHRMGYVSGFFGSYGQIYITKKGGILVTNEMYLLEAKEALEQGWFLFEFAFPEMFGPNSVVGFDPAITDSHFLNFVRELGNVKLVPIDGNLIDEIWTERPPEIKKKMVLLNESMVGEGVASKLDRVRNLLRGHPEGKSFFIANSVDIMYFLNLRGFDLEFNPIAKSYFYIDDQKAILFVDLDKVTDEVRAHLAAHHVHLEEYERSFEVANNFKANGWKTPILISPLLTYKMASLFDGNSVISAELMYERISRIAELKSVKNSVELAKSKEGHLRDSVALVEFLHWMEEEYAANHEYSERELADKIDSIRTSKKNFVSFSFPTISCGDQHAAMPHYDVFSSTKVQKITKNSAYLLDSGAHYWDGSTDVTRTLFLNPANVSANFSRAYTVVTKAHIVMAMGEYPRGVTYAEASRKSLEVSKKYDMDYRHGIGHGIGHIMNVHEPLAPTLWGNDIFTIEPGVYFKNQFGIRLENSYFSVVKNETLMFEPLTFVPIQTSILDKSILTKEEIAWINSYHWRVMMKVGRELITQNTTYEVFAWLRKKTRRI